MVVKWFIELSKSPRLSLAPPSYDRYSVNSFVSGILSVLVTEPEGGRHNLENGSSDISFNSRVEIPVRMLSYTSH